MKHMLRVLLAGGFLIASSSFSARLWQQWIRLFDGKTLKGWHTIPGGEWKVENGVIVGRSLASDERHGLLVTDSTFDNFELRVRYKAIRGNSGLYFRTEEVGGIVGVNGFQAEIDPDKDAGGLYETGGRAWVIQPSPADVKKWYKPGQWNSMTVIANGRSVKVIVNGYTTAELNDDPGRNSGHIALQLHGGMDMHVEFKEVLLRRLTTND